MTSEVNLSVIIVTRNTCAFTCAAVRSVFESADKLIKEVIVVDNGSTDQTASTIAKEFPAVKYLHSEKNLGFARANNLGAKAAQGKLLLLLNSDARLQAESLSRASSWVRAHPEVGVAGAQLLNPDGTKQNSIANFPSLATELLNKSLLRRVFPKKFPGKERKFSEPTEVASVIGAFFLVPRSVWESLGGFDERYFFFFEETDFCLHVWRKGLKVFHLPEVQVWHEQGKSASQWSVQARIEYWRSRYSYFRKNNSAAAVVALRGGLLLRLGVELVAGVFINALTFGQSAKWKHKLRIHWELMSWHLRGCPDSVGLPR